LLEFYKNKKVFITGHTGFKGSWLCRILLKAGAEITGYALEPPTEPSLFELGGIKQNINSICGDVGDLELLKTSLVSSGAEIIFHMAAQPLVRDSYKAPVKTYATNVMGTVNILEACRYCKSAKSIVNITTDKVYENKEWNWGYRENETLCGRDPYSNSKSCSELVTYSYKHSFYSGADSPALSTARSGNVIGGGDFACDRIVPDFIRAAEKKQDLIVRNPHSIRPYQHVLDCLYGYLLLARKQYEDKNIAACYNFGPEEDDCVSTGALADTLCRAWGEGVKWENQYDGGPHEASFLKLDCSMAKSVLKWEPRLNIDDAVRLTVEWSQKWLAGNDFNSCMDRQILEYFNNVI